ncbi:hypothetical protein SO802_005406 [Lithocarpus litseifolius]|uniref:Uncharacterized protein n=1 Tax=Lithocarpus litseifolius TaxID=425828 RepID=A0AAW2DL49_9ROSI
MLDYLLLRQSNLFSLMHQVALPALTTTATGFLQNYIDSILALQGASCRLAQGCSSSRDHYRNRFLTELHLSLFWLFNMLAADSHKF